MRGKPRRQSKRRPRYRVPFTGVKSSGVKEPELIVGAWQVWAKFDHDTRSCGTVKDVLRQGRWFLGQIKE
eukprot:1586872-Rhodomonas_salina.1